MDIAAFSGLKAPWPLVTIHHGNLTEALSAASEMEHVGLVEALDVRPKHVGFGHRGLVAEG
jgi:hypothetical protein